MPETEQPAASWQSSSLKPFLHGAVDVASAEDRPNHPRQSPTIQSSSSHFPVLGSPTATLEVVGDTGHPSSEKAGVGGSIPSLDTIIPKVLAENFGTDFRWGEQCFFLTAGGLLRHTTLEVAGPVTCHGYRPGLMPPGGGEPCRIIMRWLLTARGCVS